MASFALLGKITDSGWRIRREVGRSRRPIRGRMRRLIGGRMGSIEGRRRRNYRSGSWPGTMWSWGRAMGGKEESQTVREHITKQGSGFCSGVGKTGDGSHREEEENN